MAKKKPVELTADEKQEQATLEANVAAQEAAEAKAETAIEAVVQPVVDDVLIPPPAAAPKRIPHPDENVQVMPKYVPTYSPYGDGQYAADHRLDKDLFIMIGEQRYEHVSETPDGRWVYRKS